MRPELLARPRTRMPFVNSPLLYLPREKLLAATTYSGTGEDACLFLIDPARRSARKHRLPAGEKGAYGFVLGSDGNLYLGTFGGKIFRFEPKRGTLVEIARPFCENGEATAVTWGGGASSAGNVYMGAYPTGDFCEYNIASGRATIVRPMPPRNGLGFYARAFLELPDGGVLVFVGGARPSLFVYRPEAGAVETVNPGENLPTFLSFEGYLDRNRAIVNKDGKLTLFDWRKRKFAGLLADNQPEPISHLARRGGVLHGVGYPSGTIYAIRDGRALVAREPLSLRDGRLIGLCCPDDVDFVSLTDNGLFVRFGLDGGAPESFQAPNWSRRGMEISLLEARPGRAWLVGAHFINMQLFTVDARTGRARSSGRKVSGYSGQVTCGTWHGRVFYFASYGHAVLYRFQPEKPFSPGCNPAVIGTVGQEQNRPVGMAGDGRRLFLATKANYGCLGGAISVFTPASGEFEVYRNFVPDQNPGRIFFDRASGRLGGATDIVGDQGSAEATAKQAVVFVWDVKKRALLATFTPWDARALPATALSPDGLLVGFGPDTVYRCDLRAPACTAGPWRHGPVRGGLFLDRRLFLGAGPKELFLFDFDADSYRPLLETEGTRLLTRLGRREIVFDRRGTEIWKLRLPAHVFAPAGR